MFSSCRNQSNDLQCKLIDWFLYDGKIKPYSFLVSQKSFPIRRTEFKFSSSHFTTELLQNNMKYTLNLGHVIILGPETGVNIKTTQVQL